MKTTLYILLITVLFPFFATAQWEQTNGPFGADNIVSIVEHDGVVLVSAARAGIFRSTDYGENWEKVRDANSIVHLPVLHMTHDGTLFASDSGIVRSMDYGDTWQQVNTGLEIYNFSSIDSDSSGVIYAATQGTATDQCGLYRSENDGDTWSCALDEGSDFSTLHVTSNGTVWYSSANGLWRSDENGENWVSVTSPLPTLSYINSIQSDTSGSVYVSTFVINSLWKTDDNGNTWVELLNYGDMGEIRLLGVDHDNEVYANLDGIFNRSSDGGSTWQVIPGFDNQAVSTIRSVNSDTLLIGSSSFSVDIGNGFRISFDNGDTWQLRNNGMIATRINSIAVSQQQERVFAIDTRLWMSEDMGDTWNDIGSNTGSNIFYTIKSYPTGLYLSSQNGNTWRLLRSVDEGATWQLLNFDVDLIDFSVNSQGHIFVSTTEFLYRSTDEGETWDLLMYMDDEVYVEKLAISSTDAVLIKTRDDDNFMVSNDNGDTWTILDNLDENLKFIKADSIGNFYYVGLDNRLMRYRWIPSETNYILEDITPDQLEIMNILSLYVNPDNEMFLQTDTGLYRSSDTANTWTDYYSETVLPEASFIDMAYAPESGYLFGAHSSTGVWMSPLGIATDVNDIAVDNKPTISVYPNPARSTVTISSNDLENANDIITMYNQAGSVIRQVQLVNSTATLSLEGIQPGVYILGSSTGTGVKIVVK